jgi:rhodanese-related sulfurtransferase
VAGSAVLVLAALGVAGALAFGSDDDGDQAPAPANAAASTGVGTSAGNGVPAATVLAPQAAAELIRSGGSDLVVLDVRTPAEFAAGHLAGAVNIDVRAADFATRVASLDSGKRYVVYCRTGVRSAQAVAVLRERGFARVYDVSGGITAWQEAKLPVTTT